MAAVSNSVVHLTMQFGSTVLSIGTGTLYKKNDEYFIVTAWHNLTGLHTATLSHLSPNLAVPDNVVATLAVAYPDIGFQHRMSITLPLVGSKNALFYIHPKNWPRIDVAAIPFDPNADYETDITLPTGEVKRAAFSILAPISGNKAAICPIQNYLVPSRKVVMEWLNTVEVTEELFIPGYPHNLQDYYVQPVWKRATIASSVQSGWNNERKFLVDSASKSGMSGSPVLFYSPNGVVRALGKTYNFQHDVAILAGVYVGRVGVTKEADPQIGTVWHSAVIDEIIDGKIYENLPNEIEVSNDELTQVVNAALSQCSATGLRNVNDPNMPSRIFLQRGILDQLGGRASPARVLDAISELALTYDGPLISEPEE